VSAAFGDAPSNAGSQVWGSLAVSSSPGLSPFGPTRTLKLDVSKILTERHVVLAFCCLKG